MAVDTGSGTTPNRGVPVTVPGYTAQYKPAGNIHRWLYTSVPTLSTNQIAQILYQVGFRGDALVAFLAVAMRESAGGGTWIVGDPTGGASHEYSFGIFGLNTLGGAWDEMKRMVPGLTDRSQLLNPVVGAMVAFKMYQKYGERPWKVKNGTWNPNGDIFGGTMGKAAAQRAVLKAEQAGLFRTPFMDPRWNFNAPYGLVPSNPSGSSGAGTPPTQPGTGGPVSTGADTRPGAPGASGGGGTVEDERFEGYGGGAMSASVTPAPAEMTDEELRDFIRENYGYMSAYFDDPEIGPILREAARGGWSRDKLYGRLSQTNWWKTTSDAGRKWDALIKEDHATADRMNREKQAEIANIAGKAGLAFSATDLINLADVAIRFGWTDDQLHDSISQHLQARWGQNGPQGGDAGHAMQVARQAAAAQMVKVSDAELQDFAVKWVAQETSQEDMEARMAARARAQYAGNPDLIALLDKGMKLSDAFAGHRGQIARLLEVSPESIDLTSSDWQGVLQHPSGTGVRAMTITEAMKLARQTDQYASTDGARKTLVQAARTLQKAMGF